ncbi:MAG: DUF3185 family protein [Planctomycetes bacterium]|nr:DUF3185 family protein [Planctomycetota bacterium]
MNTSLSIVLLIVGVALLVTGVIASDSLSNDVSRFFTGELTNRTLWFLIGGVVAAAVGLGGLLRVAR